MNDLEKFIIARWAYSIGKPLISDAEYTLLFNMMKGLYPDNEYVTRSWSSDPCPIELLRKYNLESMIMAVVITDKTESIPSLNTLLEVQQEFGDLDYDVTVSYKHDGWNLQASYYNGKFIHMQTRGRTNDAVTIKDPKGLIPMEIPMQGKVTVIMEVTVPNSVFIEVKKVFGNTSQRGSVSTLLANEEWRDKLEAHAFQIRCAEPVDNFSTLKRWGFKTPDFMRVNNYTELLKAIDFLSDEVINYGSPTDGLVVAGQKTRAIRIRAWEEPIYRSFVTGFVEEYGPYAISIQLQIYPIKLQNSVQRQIPITNISRVITNDLQLGSPIAFRLRSSSISDFDADATRMLRKEYANRYDEYQLAISQNELLKEE